MMESTYYMNTPVSIALLPDLHGYSFESILPSLRTHRPDMIAVAGDVLYGSIPENDRSPLETQGNVLPFLTNCASIAPVFFSLGNHEWMLDERDLEVIRSTGTVVLDNEWIEWNGLIIGGLTSAHVTEHRRYLNKMDPDRRALHRYPAKQRRNSIFKYTGIGKSSEPSPETAWLSGFASAAGYHILLCHHPEYLHSVPPSVELILSGHAHGGQWRLGGHGVFAPGQGWWPKLTSGVYSGRLVVSRGLSNTSSIPRLFNPPEIVYIQQKDKQDTEQL